MITAKSSTGLSAEIQAGAHALISDVKTNLGGADRGPSPHEILESALAACTVITVKMYAQRKGWPLTGMNVEVGITEEGPEGTKLRRGIHFEGALSEEQRTRLLDIANKCPIHRLLSGRIEITTALT